MASINKAEMKKSEYKWVETTDGSIQQVEEEVAMMCPMIREEVLKKKGVGSSKNNAIRLPEKVNPEMLRLIFDYCRFHLAPGRSVMERKMYGENLIRMDPKKLVELASAADSLQLNSLVDLTSHGFARMIRGTCTREEMREICQFPYDLTEEEKLKPVENPTNDARIRLLNKLKAKKLKELKEGKKLKSSVAVEKDERSVDDLLSFIDGEDDPKVVKKTSKTKKKKKKNKRQTGTSTGTCEASSEKDSHNISDEIVDKTESSFLGDEIVDKTESSFLGDEIVDKTESSFLGDEIVDEGIDDGGIDDEIVDEGIDDGGIDDGDIDDEIDPASKEILDREVEEFARRLNLAYDEIAR